ncbi:hypothetical protein ASC89_22050 [Devosia sp. Root413D1]|uniref:NnrU family protein n=1 Tax=Devosia sp. Root413D1 TaxID=1736531 RepID=UPI0006FA9C8C|nr:NnrU family protein [Devosia sp. Root413D1]KQW75622.1 hypothetical protein ASC89_22050 [Devosia sp. Root413D1]
MLSDPAGWGELATAMTVFLLTHAIPARPALRGRLVALLGRRVYLIAYSAVSILVLVWVIGAAANAPYLEVWPRADWQSLVPAVGMLLASILAVFALTMPNPLSLGPKRDFDPDRPGVAGFVRHPLLWAMLIWSISHMFPNGDLSHVVMFGLFALLSAGGMVMFDRQYRKTLGDAVWQQLSKKTSNIPLASFAKGWRPRLAPTDGLRFGAGLLLYGTLVVSHGLITGVPLL